MKNVINSDYSISHEKGEGNRRAEAFFDAGTFVEIGAHIRRPNDSAEFEGVVTGYGAVDGKLVFAFFHMSYVLIPIFVIAIIVCYIIVWNYAESMKKKYEEMKTRKDNLDKGKEEKAKKKKDFPNPIIKTHEKPKKKAY
jgi:acetyl-CoA carboxylase carboxyltransferase component